MSDKENVIRKLQDALEEAEENGKLCAEIRRPIVFGAISMLKEQDTNGWVSVKDRLPNDGQDVLAYLYNGEETRIAPFNYDKGTWYDCVMNYTVAINSITHWMPIPEPPKDGAE